MAHGSIRGRAGGLADDGAGFLLGVFVWALVINFLQGGPERARQWLAAKFVNRVPGEGGDGRGRGGRRLDPEDEGGG